MNLVKPYVIISILNWNSYKQTIHCIEQLEHQLYEPKTIIVIDNASTDASVEAINRAFPYVHLIESDFNNGYAAGHRYAVDLAIACKADLIWLLNADIELSNEHVLSELVNAYLGLGDAVFGSLLIRTDATEVIADRSYYIVESGLKSHELMSIKNIYNPADHGLQTQRVAFISGASCLIPTNLIRSFGYMREDFFLYAEEQDFCYRLYLQGICTYLVPTSQISHQNRGTAHDHTNLQSVMIYYYLRNKLVMTRLYGGLFAYFRAVFTQRYLNLIFKVLIRSLFFPVQSKTTFLRDRLQALAIRDSLINRLGKTIEPENFV